jgi:hypothetical protein
MGNDKEIIKERIVGTHSYVDVTALGWYGADGERENFFPK